MSDTLSQLPDVERQTRLLRREEVERVTGLKTSGLYESVARGRFPRPVKIHARAVGWVSSEVDAWVRERIAARDAKHPPAREPVDTCDTRVR